jgi:hypothetical protein
MKGNNYLMKVSSNKITDPWVTRWDGAEIPAAPRYATGEQVLIGDFIEYDFFGVIHQTFIKEIRMYRDSQGDVGFTIDPLHYPGLVLYPDNVKFICRGEE